MATRKSAAQREQLERRKKIALALGVRLQQMLLLALEPGRSKREGPSDHGWSSNVAAGVSEIEQGHFGKSIIANRKRHFR